MKLTGITVPNIIWLARAGFLTCSAVILWLALDRQPLIAGFNDLDKLNHIFAFVTLALLLDYSFPFSERFWLKWLTLLCFGVTIELLQLVSGYRYFEWSDILADASGLAAYLLVRPRFRLALDKRLGLSTET
jgi:VanZ family protein